MLVPLNRHSSARRAFAASLRGMVNSQFGVNLVELSDDSLGGQGNGPSCDNASGQRCRGLGKRVFGYCHNNTLSSVVGTSTIARRVGSVDSTRRVTVPPLLHACSSRNRNPTALSRPLRSAAPFAASPQFRIGRSQTARGRNRFWSGARLAPVLVNRSSADFSGGVL